MEIGGSILSLHGETLIPPGKLGWLSSFVDGIRQHEVWAVERVELIESAVLDL